MRSALLPLFALIMAGCPTPVDPAPTFTADIQPIFEDACTISGCHGGPEAETGLDLDPDGAYDMLVGVSSAQLPSMKRVEPSDAENSYLVHKMADTHLDVDGSGDIMPPVVGSSSSDVQLVIDWIAAGALND